MRLPIIAMMLCLLLQAAADAYLFFISWQRSRKLTLPKFQLWQGAFFLVYFVVILCMPKRTDSNTTLQLTMWMLFIYINVYATKVVFIIFDLLASIPLLWHKKRIKAVTTLGIILAALTFALMWWGALFNRYNIQINEVNVRVEGLPKDFAGYRIAQISDLHVGTYGNDTTFVHKLVEEVNSLQPDLIVFTGDIVNRRTDELEPFVHPLSRLKARDGVISILGNHDYGDYFDWGSPAEREANLERLMDLQIEMNWELLTNSSTLIYGDNANDSIIIIGVENWGDPPFPTYGDLAASYSTPGDSAVKILLTHNPAHWVEEIAPNDSLKIDLTLSGHTHAMQMSIGHISPAVFRYKSWGGLYDSPDGRRPLYVNIGTGTVGMPMRVGATPEITLFTLFPKGK